MFAAAEPFAWNLLDFFIKFKSKNRVPEGFPVTILVKFPGPRTYADSLAFRVAMENPIEQTWFDLFGENRNVLTFELFCLDPFLILVSFKHLGVNLLDVFFVRFTWIGRIPCFRNVMTLSPVTVPRVSHEFTDKPVIFLVG